MTDSWFDMKEAVRMRDTYVKVLQSSRELLNAAYLEGKPAQVYLDQIKLYENLLESATKRIKALEKEEADDQS